MGIRWQYGSGFPYSEPLGIKPRIILADNDLDGKPETPVISTRTNYLILMNRKLFMILNLADNKLNARKPAYHRLDLRLTALAEFLEYELDILS